MELELEEVPLVKEALLGMGLEDSLEEEGEEGESYLDLEAELEQVVDLGYVNLE